MLEEDKQYVKAYLNEKEQALFFQLKVYEQAHCLDVARQMARDVSIKDCHDEEKKQLIRIGLLHDIGKIKYPLNPIEKSIIVVLDKVTKGKIKNFTQLKMVKCYYEHAELGYILLKETGNYDEFFLEIIKNHHMKNPQDMRASLLKKCDDRA